MIMIKITIIISASRLCNSRRLSVRLSVCYQLYVKTTERMFMKISLPHDVYVDKEELIKFGMSSASVSVIGHFPTNSLISLDKLIITS